jgi:conjugal transfer pilus assembly protein TraW
MFILLMLIAFSERTLANDLGVMGETYKIAEIDFLEYIQSQIEQKQKNGQWQILQEQVRNKITYLRDRPRRVEGLSRAQENKRWLFDPSIILDRNIFTKSGNLIATAGTHVNPLVYISLSKTLIFFDGDDQEQVAWAIEQNKKINNKSKLILINGSLIKIESKTKTRLYFDQEGRLTNRFGIKHVPALVRQEGLKLLINEVRI